MGTQIAPNSDFDWDDYDPNYEDRFSDPDYCDECDGSGRVTTADHESYFGAMYKTCPKCHGDLTYYGPLS